MSSNLLQKREERNPRSENVLFEKGAWGGSKKGKQNWSIGRKQIESYSRGVTFRTPGVSRKKERTTKILRFREKGGALGGIYLKGYGSKRVTGPF